jgi:type IV secretory pathway VirB6-like protein
VLNKKYIINKQFILLISLILFAICFIFPAKLNAGKTNGPERIRSCDANTGAVSKYADTDNPPEAFREMEYDLSNPTCLGLALGAYAGVKTTILAVNTACNQSTVVSPFPSIVEDIKIYYRGVKQAYKIGNNECKIALAAVPTAVLASFVALGSILAAAKVEYESVQVCGYDWYAPNPKKFSNSNEGSYKKYVFEENKSNPGMTYANNKEYREKFHNGKEFEDRPPWGDEWCKDPATGNPQKYYLRGLQQGDFGCEKYNPSLASRENKDKYQSAYSCCLKRRQNFICLEKIDLVSKKYYDHIFCQAGKKCAFITNPGGINYDIYKKENNRLVCAKTYNLCPYNFSIKGGSPYVDYYKDGKIDSYGKWTAFRLNDDNSYPNDCSLTSEVRKTDCTFNEKVGKVKNYCQYYTHCTVVSPTQYNSDYNNFTPYFSKACLDSIGDSQNVNSSDSFNPGFGFGSQNNFSAPVVQCIKETMENIFNNTAGHSKCSDGSYGGRYNECRDNGYQSLNDSGTLIWKKGTKVSEISIFENLQSRLRFVITGLLIIAVVFMGAKILLLKVDMTNKKDMMLFIFKIALVIYFVRGDAWRSIFFDGIYNGASEISRIFFKINSFESGNRANNASPSYKCNFGALYDQNSMEIASSKSNSYPAGSKYLMIWDTLDCKIMQYLNYGPGFSSGAVFAMIIASFFTGGIGVTIGMSIFILAFSLIATVIRAMHIFVSSCIAIVIYVFISPIIIPLVLFEKTKSIFDAWFSHLISFALQPIVLFSFLGIFISLSEKILYNGAVYDSGSIVCRKYCREKSNMNNIITNLDTCKSSPNYTNIIDPQEITPVCIINFTEFDEGNGFAMIGLMFKVVPNLNSLKVMIILKCALFLFVLLKMVDEIPGVIQGLTGQSIDTKGVDGFEMLKKFTSNFRAAQKRAARGGASFVGSMMADKDRENDDGDDKAGDSEKESKDSSDSVSFK